MGDLAVTYYSNNAQFQGKLAIESAGVTMNFGKKRSGSYSWDEVRRISFDDPGRTKASVGAIAVFGVLGLAARKSYSLITVSVPDQDLYFTSPFAIGQWRASALRIVEDIPQAASKVYVDGQPVGSRPEAGSANDDIIDQVKRLGELHDAGVLTDKEFAAKKAELLARL